MKMGPPASAQLAVSSPEADRLLAVLRRTGQPPMFRLLSPTPRNPEMLQNHCSRRRSPPQEKSTGREICCLPLMKMTLVELRRTTGCPPRMLKAMIENGVSQYNEDRWRWQENGGGGAGQGDRGGQPPPPPRGDGDQPRGQHRQVGIIDGDATGAAIDGVLSALAKRFEKPSRPPPPPIPVFKDS